MKPAKYSLIIFLIFSMVRCAYPQQIISTKTVVLRFEKQTDTLKIPVVSGKYPALKEALSFKNLGNGDDLRAVIKNYDTCGCGLTSLSYKMTFKSKDVLSIIIYDETMTAYPDTHEQWLTLNIQTGKGYPIENEINPRGLNWIFNTYKKTLMKRIVADKDESTEDGKAVYNELRTAVDSLQKEELLGKYVFTKTGILFSIEEILPHVVQSAEPDREVLFPYDKLKLYRKPGAIILK